mmetsp:Transcript_85306/g.215032  ORF Transcript_85306/g.215032 Transcript_85306/m.215032 type:complete len:243 (+) Transcript_85306:1479-2207(+)
MHGRPRPDRRGRPGRPHGCEVPVRAHGRRQARLAARSTLRGARGRRGGRQGGGHDAEVWRRGRAPQSCNWRRHAHRGSHAVQVAFKALLLLLLPRRRGWSLGATSGGTGLLLRRNVGGSGCSELQMRHAAATDAAAQHVHLRLQRRGGGRGMTSAGLLWRRCQEDLLRADTLWGPIQSCCSESTRSCSNEGLAQARCWRGALPGREALHHPCHGGRPRPRGVRHPTVPPGHGPPPGPQGRGP